MKCFNPLDGKGVKKSPPAWGAWIEIPILDPIGDVECVAPRMGGVD